MANFLAELKRRHVYRVAAAYAVVAWVLIQLVNNITPMLNLPASVGTIVLVLLAVGFPVAVLFAWIHQLAPADGAAPSPKTSKLDWTLIGALVVVIALVSYQQLAPSSGARTGQQARGTPAPGSMSVAVLPFVNLSSDKEQEFFSDGRTEEITAALAKIPNLQVVGRTSAFEFKGQNKDLRTIGQALGATHIIEGSVRKAGDRVRITAQLIRADNGLHLWTENYDRELKDVFAVQEDIAQAIAASLRVPLGLKEGERLVSNRTDDLESYQEYLRGRALLRARTINQAIAVLEPAVARDPNYAPAWAVLAEASVFAPAYGIGVYGIPFEERRKVIQSFNDKAETAARNAIRLDPKHAGGYAALAYVQGARGKWAESDDLFRQALALDANDADALHLQSLVAVNAGRLKQTLGIRKTLQTLEPFVPVYNLFNAVAMQFNGQGIDSISILQSIPNEGGVGAQRTAWLALALAATGRYGQAADAILAMQPNQTYFPKASVENAASLLRSAPAKAPAPEKLPDLENALSFVYGYIGAPDRLLDSAERSIDADYRMANDIRVLWHPAFSSIRKTERFKELMRKAGLVDYWKARGWPDLCHPTTGDDFECN